MRRPPQSRWPFVVGLFAASLLGVGLRQPWARLIAVTAASLGALLASVSLLPYLLQDPSQISILRQSLRIALEEIHYLYGERGAALMHGLRHLLGRARPTTMEVRLLLGLARQIRWFVRHGGERTNDQ